MRNFLQIAQALKAQLKVGDAFEEVIKVIPAYVPYVEVTGAVVAGHVRDETVHFFYHFFKEIEKPENEEFKDRFAEIVSTNIASSNTSVLAELRQLCDQPHTDLPRAITAEGELYQLFLPMIHAHKYWREYWVPFDTIVHDRAATTEVEFGARMVAWFNPDNYREMGAINDSGSRRNFFGYLSHIEDSEKSFAFVMQALAKIRQYCNTQYIGHADATSQRAQLQGTIQNHLGCSQETLNLMLFKCIKTMDQKKTNSRKWQKAEENIAALVRYGAAINGSISNANTSTVLQQLILDKILEDRICTSDAITKLREVYQIAYDNQRLHQITDRSTGGDLGQPNVQRDIVKFAMNLRYTRIRNTTQENQRYQLWKANKWFVVNELVKQFDAEQSKTPTTTTTTSTTVIPTTAVAGQPATTTSTTVTSTAPVVAQPITVTIATTADPVSDAEERRGVLQAVIDSEAREEGKAELLHKAISENAPLAVVQSLIDAGCPVFIDEAGPPYTRHPLHALTARLCREIAALPNDATAESEEVQACQRTQAMLLNLINVTPGRSQQFISIVLDGIANNAFIPALGAGYYLEHYKALVHSILDIEHAQYIQPGLADRGAALPPIWTATYINYSGPTGSTLFEAMGSHFFPDMFPIILNWVENFRNRGEPQAFSFYLSNLIQAVKLESRNASGVKQYGSLPFFQRFLERLNVDSDHDQGMVISAIAFLQTAAAEVATVARISAQRKAGGVLIGAGVLATTFGIIAAYQPTINVPLGSAMLSDALFIAGTAMVLVGLLSMLTSLEGKKNQTATTIMAVLAGPAIVGASSYLAPLIAASLGAGAIGLEVTMPIGIIVGTLAGIAIAMTQNYYRKSTYILIDEKDENVAKRSNRSSQIYDALASYRPDPIAMGVGAVTGFAAGSIITGALPLCSTFIQPGPLLDVAILITAAVITTLALLVPNAASPEKVR